MTNHTNHANSCCAWEHLEIWFELRSGKWRVCVRVGDQIAYSNVPREMTDEKGPELRMDQQSTHYGVTGDVRTLPEAAQASEGL